MLSAIDIDCEIVLVFFSIFNPVLLNVIEKVLFIFLKATNEKCINVGNCFIQLIILCLLTHILEDDCCIYVYVRML